MPDQPLSNSDNCAGAFYSVRRDIKEIQTENRNKIIVLISGSLAAGLFLGPVVLLPIALSPYLQIKSKEKADKVIKEWDIEYCRESN